MAANIMSTARFPKILFLTVIIAALAEGLHDFQRLPEQMASHFNALGLPTNWMAKSYFFDLYAGLVLLAALIEFLVFPLIAVIPPWAFNLPHKQYWLAPDRIDETYRYLDSYFAWSGLVFLLLEVCIMHLVLEANLRPIPQLPMSNLLFLIVAFILINALSTTSLLRRFSRTRGEPSLGPHS